MKTEFKYCLDTVGEIKLAGADNEELQCIEERIRSNLEIAYQLKRIADSLEDKPQKKGLMDSFDRGGFN